MAGWLQPATMPASRTDASRRTFLIPLPLPLVPPLVPLLLPPLPLVALLLLPLQLVALLPPPTLLPL